ncbi:MAG TPA: SRPBCC domain-containing protein [Candidatus Limnocylindria bacterium]|jgi:hypothetical protein
METQTTDLVIHKSVRVRISQEAAFRLFTEGIGTWWPAITHSVAASAETRAGMDAAVGGEIYELSPTGRVTWGTITEWDPPNGFAATWHPGDGAELATRWSVRFVAEGPQATRVELEHAGWEVHGTEAQERFQGYLVGWDPVLGRFVERAGG